MKQMTLSQYVKMLKNDLPIATKKSMVTTLNILARETRGEVLKNIKSKFNLRNKYTEHMTIYEKATESKLESIAGTKAEYMGYHETGETLSKNLWGSSKNTNPMATKYARVRNGNGVLAQRYRFHKMGHVATSSNRKSSKSKGFFILKTKRGSPAIYERIRWGKGVGKGGIRAVRILKKSKTVTKKAFFDKASNKVLKSKKAFQGYSSTMNIYLP